MKGLLKLVSINSLSIFLVSLIFGGIKIEGDFLTYVYAGAFLAIISTLIDPVVKIVTLPFHILTLGLISFLTTLISLLLITLFYKNVQVTNFTFGGISFLGIDIDRIFISGFLSFVVISATIYFLNKFLDWIFSD